ncbi:MAG: hypothetical protein IJJ26_12145, partial [Victivallales bacterium]|nr:hypothetical protein [Victivallales bacterium]
RSPSRAYARTAGRSVHRPRPPVAGLHLAHTREQQDDDFCMAWHIPGVSISRIRANSRSEDLYSLRFIPSPSHAYARGQQAN